MICRGRLVGLIIVESGRIIHESGRIILKSGRIVDKEGRNNLKSRRIVFESGRITTGWRIVRLETLVNKGPVSLFRVLGTVGLHYISI